MPALDYRYKFQMEIGDSGQAALERFLPRAHGSSERDRLCYWSAVAANVRKSKTLERCDVASAYLTLVEKRQLFRAGFHVQLSLFPEPLAPELTA